MSHYPEMCRNIYQVFFNVVEKTPPCLDISAFKLCYVKNLPILILVKAVHSISALRYQVKHLKWINTTQV